MVDISDRIAEIKKMVDAGRYLTINRARQYGKTTTIAALEELLKNEKTLLSLDFQRISDAAFRTEESFVRAFCRIILKKNRTLEMPGNIAAALDEIVKRQGNAALFDELFAVFSDWCEAATKPIVMIIDEVDSAANNQVFLDFLAQLRADYIEREKDPEYHTFQSVILAGVTDVKNLKRKLRPDDEKKVNSPWNIAADFEIDMSLSADGICGMLNDYENDHHTGMDIEVIAQEIRDYTNGYPFLVSRICQLIDTAVLREYNTLEEAWTIGGVKKAVNLLQKEKNTLFQSLTEKLTNYPELKASLRCVLMEGVKLPYNADQEDISQMQMYGFILNYNNTVRIANRIFETRLYDLFLSDEELNNNAFTKDGDLNKNIFTENGRLKLRVIMEHFIETFHQIYGELEEKFKEKDGRELFLLYLRPIINGTGNYYIEAQTRDQKRTDVIIDYLGRQYIIELKIWRGERYNAAGEKQICEYLDYWNLDTGYMLSFNFNKAKETGVKKIYLGEKTLFEGTV